jgi:hypothetical protein
MGESPVSKKFVVVWGRTGETGKLIPVDEKFLKDTPEEAKEVARDLLPMMREPNLMPVEILEIPEEKHQQMLESTTPLLTFNQETDLEVEMLELAP